MLDSWPTNDALKSRVRPFGVSVDDLDMDFDNAAAVSVTQLLRSCLTNDLDNTFSTDDVLQWSLARRLQRMIDIVIATRGDELTLEVHCHHQDCREEIELQLQLSMFHQATFDDVIPCQVNSSTTLKLRLPNGFDQLHWLQQTDEGDWHARMAASLVESVNNKKPGDDFIVEQQWLGDIENELEKYDSLMALELESSCPQCKRIVVVPLELEHQLLNILHFEQTKLFNDIHILAQAYHWSEGEIMALSSKRRQYYLGLLNQEGEWS